MNISEFSRATAVIPSRVFNAWADPVAWPYWDLSIKSVQFIGPMELGSTGRLIPTAGPPSKFTITDLVADRVLTNTSRLPGARLDFIHQVEPRVDHHVVSVAVHIVGPLARMWSGLLRSSLAESAPTSVNGLVDMLERSQP